MRALLSLLVLVTLQCLFVGECRLHTQGVQEHLGHLKEEHSVHSLALDSQRQPGGSTTTVSHQSWFERLGNAFWSVVIGFVVVIPFSISFLWVNENRNAKFESLISLGESEVESIEAKQVDLADYDGTLVHMNSENAMGLDLVQDERFPDVKKDSGIIRLMSDVQVYQWVETKHERKKKDSLGGGETTVVTYSYSEEWSSKVVDSSSFHDKYGHDNTVHVSGLSPGSREAVNNTVKYGDAYWLTRDLVMDLANFEDASDWIGKTLKFGSYTFTMMDGYYKCPERSGKPQIGDFKARITYVLDGPASILALQMKDKSHEGGRTFGPYRMVSRGCCGVSKDELKHRCLDAVRKSDDDLYDDDKCVGPFACLCCCCNIVKYCFTHLHNIPVVGSSTITLTPQLYNAWPGKLSIKECFSSEKRAGMAMKWGFRLLGWLLLWIGFMMLFEPLEVFADIIPFLGPYLGSGLKFIISFFCFLLTLVLATLIVSLAYMIYHPLMGMLCFGGTAVLVAGIVVLTKYMETKGQQGTS